MLTTLFGAGWPRRAPPVLPNAATERWLGGGRRPPGGVERLQRVTAPVLSRTPEALHARVVPFARPSQPLLAPRPPTDDGPGSLLEAGPLYAGETVARIDDVRPAAEIVRELLP